jgi:potassium efflux system protein
MAHYVRRTVNCTQNRIHSVACLLLTVYLAIGVASAPAWAANPATTAATTTAAVVPPPKPSVPPPPKAPFDLSEAATESESVSITVRGIEADLNTGGMVGQIEQDLPTLTTEIKARLDESNKLLSSSPSLQVLGTQEQDWEGIKQNLDAWEHILAQREDLLNQHKKTLDDLNQRWAQAREVLNYYKRYGSTSARQLRDKLEEPLTSAETQIHKTIADRNFTAIQTFALKQTVNGQLAQVSDILDSIRRAQADAFSRLFARNSPALWNVPLRSTGDTGLVTQSLDSFSRQLQAVVSYFQRRIANVALQAAILLVLAIGLFRLRKAVQHRADEDVALKQVTLAFKAPIATALVLSLLLSMWIYPQAPRMFWAMIGAASLIPTVIILRRLIDRRLFTILNSLVVFYFLDQLRSIVAVVPVVARLLLMLEMLGAAVLLIVFIRSTRQEQTSARVWAIVRFIGWLWTAAFILAFFGDVIGYESLANVIGDAALGSAYLAVILYACARVLSSLFVIAMRSRPLVLLKMVRNHQQVLLARVRTFLYWIAGVAWVLGVLASLSLATPAWEFLGKILSAQLSIGELHITFGHVLEFLLTVWVTTRLSRTLRFVLEEDVYDRLALPGGIPYAISKIVNYIILLIGFFVGVSALGVPMTQFTVLASAFTLGIGFGLQNIFNNFVSGLILLFERPIRVGDVIQMNDTTGVVGHIGIRASIIRTPDSSEIIVPNGNLIAGQVTNWTLSNRQRGMTLSLSLASTADPCKVMDLLTRVAAAQPLVTKSPAPQAFLCKLGPDSFSYDLHVWTNNAEQWAKLRSELAVALNAELAQESIAIK